MRASRQGGDVLTVGTVAGTSPKPYPLAPVAQNISYETVSDQSEAQSNQPLSIPLTFHGGIGYDNHDRSVGHIENTGFVLREGVVQAPILSTNVALTGAANPPQYFFEANVNDSGADDGRPRLYIIAPEAAEINVYKLSLAYGYTATGTGVTTDATAKTLTDARAAWTIDEWIGEIVTCNSQTLTITSNTATVLTGTGGWSSDPSDGHAYKIGVGDFGTLLSTETFALTPTQPMGRPALWYDGTNTQWRVPTGDSTNDMQSLTAIASGTGNDTWEPTDSGTCDAAARHLQVVGQKLYRTTGNNLVQILARNTDPTTDSNWTGDHNVGSDATKITDIVESGGLCYLAKEDGFYEWDGEGDADNVFPAIGRAERNGQGTIWWHGGFLIPAASLWWTRTGKPVGPDSNPNYSAHHPAIALAQGAFVKFGRWMGLAGFGEYVYAYYVNATGSKASILQGRERDSSDPPGWGPIVWQVVAVTGASGADFDDFHGIHITELSEYNATEIRPCLWYANGNVVSYLWLDKDGGVASRRGQMDLATSAVLTGGFIDGGTPVNKQLRVIEGTAEDFGTVTGTWQFQVYRDGAAAENVGATITADGAFERFWTQDSADIAKGVNIRLVWVGSANITNTNGPHLKDLRLRMLPLPDTADAWTFLVYAKEETMRTAKKIRTEIEGYANDLKKFELPDGDSFNGIVTGIRMLRANEIRELTVDRDDKGKALPLPRYIMAVTVREMVSG